MAETVVTPGAAKAQEIETNIDAFLAEQKKLMLDLAGQDPARRQALDKHIKEQEKALAALKTAFAGTAAKSGGSETLRAENLRFLAELVVSGHKALLLIAGGALIAVLAFLGDVWGRDGVATVVANLVWPSKLLVMSLVLTLGSWLAAYAAQAFHLGQSKKAYGGALLLSIGLTIAAFTAFVCGSYGAIQAFSALPAPNQTSAGAPPSPPLGAPPAPAVGAPSP